ncbi:immunoglobulin superfamily member 10 isoform X2 [Frankliniella occidentalis]|uniref:Immunoglobulin superfamily member 10 isoform X2 n=1 Tax=Frankliniella occidentalis TaxID=133901 RepID=A0A9C6TTU0_FRAOC|nr:immunoglobulin superfamily member 10 isoform X2 [Frankliniella occidentalis]
MDMMSRPASLSALCQVAVLLCATGVLSSASHGHHQHSDPFSWTTPRGPAAGGVLDLHPPSAGAAPALASELRSSEAPPVTEYVINEHQHAVLTCDVPPELLNLVQIFWYHDNVPTETVVLGQLKAGSNGGEPDAGRRYVRDPSTGSLTISGARMEDDGVWGCQAKEATSRRVLHSGPAVRLVILVPPRPPYLLLDGRRLDPTNLFVPMREHGTLDVECVVEAGNPAPTVTWQMLLAERLLPRLDEAVDDLVSTVAVDKPTGLGGHLSSQARVQHIVREHHNATVSCLVSHPTLAVPYNATILLDVQYSPSFDITRAPGFGTPVREGSPLSLKCDVDSNPPSSPVWQKDDKSPPVEQAGDGYLNFTSVRRDHAGWYKCTCRHLLTEYSSNAYLLQVRGAEEMPAEYPPGLAGLPPPDTKHLEATLGGSVQLDCPWGPGSCWLKLGADGLLQPAVGSGPQAGTASAVLSIDRVLYQEAGEYLCARDRHSLQRWRNTYSVHMNVSGRPMVHPAVQVVTAVAGHSVTLSVEFCANPAARRVMWVTQRLLLLPGTTDQERGHEFHNITASDTVHCHVASLTLHRVRPADEGEYLLLVRSSGGASEGSVQLNVTVAEGYSASARTRPHRGLHLLAAVPVLGVLAGAARPPR